MIELCKKVKDVKVLWVEYNKVQLNTESEIYVEGELKKVPDCVYFSSYGKKNDKNSNDSKSKYIHKTLCEYFDMMGIVIINSSKTILCSVDKYCLYQKCKKLKIKCPKSVIINQDENGECCYIKVLKGYEFPIIMKYPSGSGGNFVWKVKSYEELEKLVNEKKEECFIIQEMIKESEGKDVRVCIIGKEIAFAYERKNNNEKEFRSNIEKGGERKLIEMDEKFEKLVKKIVVDLDVEIGGIDFLYGVDEMIVCEITLGFPICDVVNSLDEINSESKKK